MTSIPSSNPAAGLADHPWTPVELPIPHEPGAADRGTGHHDTPATPATPGTPGGDRGARVGGAGFLCREHVLAATRACFDEAGYDGTTIRAIAGRLGCAVGSIYRYCRDKRELLADCAAGMLEPVVQNMAAADAGFEPSVRRYVQTVERRSELYRLMFWIGDGGGGLPLVVKRVIGGWARLLGNVAEARRRWSLLHGLLMLGGDREKVIAAVCAGVHADVPVEMTNAPSPLAHVAEGPAPTAETSPDQRPPDQRPPDQRPPDQRPPDQRPPDQRPPDHGPAEPAPAPAGREDITLL